MTHKDSQGLVLELAKNVIEREYETIKSLQSQIDPNFYSATQMLLACQGHVLTTGAGTSHAVAARFAHLLNCCGTPALFIHPGDSQHGLSGAVTEKDILFCISKGGETQEVIYLARISKARGAKIISILESPDSSIGRLSDVVLCVSPPSECDPFGMIATGSSLFNSALCDALCVVLLKLRGYSKEQFGETHPGGAVGKKIEAEYHP